MGLREQLQRRRQKLLAELEDLERAIEAVGPGGLQSDESSVNVQTRMQPLARLSRSRGRRRNMKGVDNPLSVAADKAGYTMRSLAEKLKCSAPLLSQARTGVSSISMELAKQIEELTGFAATKENWPKLRSE